MWECTRRRGQVISPKVSSGLEWHPQCRPQPPTLESSGSLQMPLAPLQVGNGVAEKVCADGHLFVAGTTPPWLECAGFRTAVARFLRAVGILPVEKRVLGTVCLCPHKSHLELWSPTIVLGEACRRWAVEPSQMGRAPLEKVRGLAGPFHSVGSLQHGRGFSPAPDCTGFQNWEKLIFVVYKPPGLQFCYSWLELEWGERFLEIGCLIQYLPNT